MTACARTVVAIKPCEEFSGRHVSRAIEFEKISYLRSLPISDDNRSKGSPDQRLYIKFWWHSMIRGSRETWSSRYTVFFAARRTSLILIRRLCSYQPKCVTPIIVLQNLVRGWQAWALFKENVGKMIIKVVYQFIWLYVTLKELYVNLFKRENELFLILLFVYATE